MLNALKSIRTSPLPFSEAGRNVPDEVAVIAPLHVGSVFVPELQYAMPVMFGQVPNTTGRFYASGQVYVSGVFKKSTGSDNQRILNSNQSDVSNTTFDFSLNNDQAVYKGNKVQPSALQCLPCIRI